MEDSLDLLEEKVQKAADLVKRLRKGNKSLEDDLGKARVRLQEAEKRLQALEGERGTLRDQGKEFDALTGEVETLRQEREDVRARVAKLIEALEGLD